MLPKRGLPFNVYTVIRDADGDPIPDPQGLSAVLSRDGGPQVPATNTPVVVSAGSAVVRLTLTAAEMTADEVAVVIQSTTPQAKAAFVVIYTDTAQLAAAAQQGLLGTYASVQHVRDEGVTQADANDARVQDLLVLASRYVERVTGFWFERRAGEVFRLDGSGTPVLELPQPPVAVTEVRVDGTVVDPARYVVRNRRETDDLWAPRLELVAGLGTRLERALWGGAPAAWRPVWPRGQQNVEVRGDFGFVEPDGSTPPLIRRATVLLVVGLVRPAATAATERRRAGWIRGESLGQYSYTLADLATGTSLTGDPEIDAILLHYRRPAAVATA